MFNLPANANWQLILLGTLIAAAFAIPALKAALQAEKINSTRDCRRFLRLGSLGSIMFIGGMSLALFGLNTETEEHNVGIIMVSCALLAALFEGAILIQYRELQKKLLSKPGT